ncbi:MAG: hypothetical protein AAGA48_26055 [Myxococcota bacterium]
MLAAFALLLGCSAEPDEPFIPPEIPPVPPPTQLGNGDSGSSTIPMKTDDTGLTLTLSGTWEGTCEDTSARGVATIVNVRMNVDEDGMGNVSGEGRLEFLYSNGSYTYGGDGYGVGIVGTHLNEQILLTFAGPKFYRVLTGTLNPFTGTITGGLSGAPNCELQAD